MSRAKRIKVIRLGTVGLLTFLVTLFACNTKEMTVENTLLAGLVTDEPTHIVFRSDFRPERVSEFGLSPVPVQSSGKRINTVQDVVDYLGGEDKLEQLKSASVPELVSLEKHLTHVFNGHVYVLKLEWKAHYPAGWATKMWRASCYSEETVSKYRDLFELLVADDRRSVETDDNRVEFTLQAGYRYRCYLRSYVWGAWSERWDSPSLGEWRLDTLHSTIEVDLRSLK